MVTIDDVKAATRPMMLDGSGPPNFWVDEGWHQILCDMHEKLLEINPNIQYAQIKEKFAGLRIYPERSSEEIRTIIREAETRAAETCEVCGEPGAPYNSRMLYKTVCNTHLEELKKRRGA